jgi:thiamine kinase-like enzyme
MHTEPTTSQPASDEAELRRWLERACGERLGREVRIATMQRRPSPFASLFPADEISIATDSGERIDLFCKSLGDEESDHPEKQCRDREIRIYEELLNGEPGLPAPRYFGTRPDPLTGRRQLFLEHLDDWDLQYQDLTYWFLAARHLARFHAHFARQPGRLLECDFLLRLDGPYLAHWARRAQAALAEWLPDLAAELETVVSRYERVTDPIGRQPLTLVHNDLAPKNVIADRKSDPPRIALVDWEMAGSGCGVLDLVHLKHGLAIEDDRRMCADYFDELAQQGFAATDSARLVAACDLHITIYRLAFGKAWGVPIPTMAQWVRDVRRLYSQL